MEVNVRMTAVPTTMDPPSFRPLPYRHFLSSLYPVACRHKITTSGVRRLPDREDARLPPKHSSMCYPSSLRLLRAVVGLMGVT